MSSSGRVAAMLACVHASPEAVARHDRDAWLALFSADAEVHDPVGARPHCGAEAIARFYDTFIAPNEIDFEVAREGVCEDIVWRDVTIHTRMATGLAISVPAHLRYQLTELASGNMRIRRLCAHWELASMVRQSLRQGWLGVRTYAALTRHMLAHQGIAGAMGFARGFGGVGARGRRRAEALLNALRDGDLAVARAQLAPSATFRVDGAAVADLDALSVITRALRWQKVIAAGTQVTASIQCGESRGIAVLDFDAHGRIAHLEWAT